MKFYINPLFLTNLRSHRTRLLSLPVLIFLIALAGVFQGEKQFLKAQSDNPFSSNPFSSNPFSSLTAVPETDSVPEFKGVSVSDISQWLQDVPLKTTRSGILPEETNLYYQVLAYVKDLDLAVLKKEARLFMEERWKQSKYKSRPFEKFPLFVDIYQYPEAYQGRPVTMTGHLRRTVLSPAGDNEFGINEIGEGWLFTEDSQTNPTVVVVTELPEEFPIGEYTIDRVTVTGYMYRLYTYKARDAGRFAPLLIAKQIEWTPPESFGKDDHSWVWMIFWGVIIGVIAAMIGAFLTVLNKSRKVSHKRTLPTTIVSPEDARTEVKAHWQDLKDEQPETRENQPVKIEQTEFEQTVTEPKKPAAPVDPVQVELPGIPPYSQKAKGKNPPQN